MTGQGHIARAVLGACVGALGLAMFAPATLGEGTAGRSDDSGAQAAIRQDWEARQGMRPSAFRSETRSIFPMPDRLRAIAPPERTARLRYICARLCDGEQLVLGFDGTGVGEEDFAGMCAAAGGGAETVLLTSELDGSHASRVGDGEEFASAAVLVADLRATHRARQCPAAIVEAGFSVPIEADPTLRPGDVVATVGGFKVFVGREGAMPHKDASFVHVGDARRLAPEVRRLLGKMKVAGDS